MRQDVLFDDGSTSVYSRAFIVPQGNLAVLSAWGFDRTVKAPAVGMPRSTPQLAIVQKLAFDKGEFPNGNACRQEPGDLLVEPKYTYVEDVTQCGLWSLSACQNLVVLAVPGTYRLQLNDEAAMGNVFISMTRYSQLEAGYLPRGLFLGDVHG